MVCSPVIFNPLSQKGTTFVFNELNFINSWACYFFFKGSNVCAFFNRESLKVYFGRLAFIVTGLK